MPSHHIKFETTYLEMRDSISHKNAHCVINFKYGTTFYSYITADVDKAKSLFIEHIMLMNKFTKQDNPLIVFCVVVFSAGMYFIDWKEIERKYYYNKTIKDAKG